MSDMPGYGSFIHCEYCFSINHQTHDCHHEEDHND